MDNQSKDGPIASLIMDGLRGLSDEQLVEMLLSGFIYRPFVPLQVTPIKPQEEADGIEIKRR